MKYIKRNEILKSKGQTLVPYYSRILAFTIDAVLICLFYIFLQITMQLLGFQVKSVHLSGFTHINFESENLTDTAKFIIRCLMVSIPTLYFTLTTYYLNGQTFGKKICRVQVISIYHANIPFWHCLERSLGYVASTLELGLGFIQAMWNHNRMALHDKIAETIVVRKIEQTRVSTRRNTKAKVEGRK